MCSRHSELPFSLSVPSVVYGEIKVERLSLIERSFLPDIFIFLWINLIVHCAKDKRRESFCGLSWRKISQLSDFILFSCALSVSHIRISLLSDKIGLNDSHEIFTVLRDCIGHIDISRGRCEEEAH